MKFVYKPNVTFLLDAFICLLVVLVCAVWGVGGIYDALVVLGIACLALSGLFFVAPVWYGLPLVVIAVWGGHVLQVAGIEVVPFYWFLTIALLIGLLLKPALYFQTKRHHKYSRWWNGEPGRLSLRRFTYFSYAWLCCVAQAFIFGIIPYRNTIMPNVVLSVVCGCFIGIVCIFPFKKHLLSFTFICIPLFSVAVGSSSYFFTATVLAFAWLSSYITACVLGEPSTRYASDENSEGADEVGDWDCVRVRKLCDYTHPVSRKKRAKSFLRMFGGEKPWDLYQVQFYNSDCHQVVVRKATERIGKVLVEDAGMNETEARELECEVERLYSVGSDEWVWHPRGKRPHVLQVIPYAVDLVDMSMISSLDEVGEDADWDYLRIRQVYDRLREEPREERSRSMFNIFPDTKLWDLYEAEFYNSDRHEVIARLVTEDVGMLLIKNMGMHMIDASVTEHEARRLYSEGSDEWVWFSYDPVKNS